MKIEQQQSLKIYDLNLTSTYISHDQHYLGSSKDGSQTNFSTQGNTFFFWSSENFFSNSFFLYVNNIIFFTYVIQGEIYSRMYFSCIIFELTFPQTMPGILARIYYSTRVMTYCMFLCDLDLHISFILFWMTILL